MGEFEFPAWDPVLLDLPGPLDVRWYGLMYVVGFVVGQWILTRIAGTRVFPVAKEKVGDLIFYLVIGVILGGRIGYALFYDQGLADPMKFIRVWQGGLSFHGGLLGVVIAAWVFAKKQGLTWFHVADACSLAVCPGILAVRCANFINGELYGRVTAAGTFGAMQFPTDPRAAAQMGLDNISQTRDRELAIQYAYRKIDWDTLKGEASNTVQWEALKDRLDWEAARESVPYRHPSQLYEGLAEGLLVGLVLFVVHRLTRARGLGMGAFAGLFLIGYGTVRWLLELLRQPDRQFTGPDDDVGLVLLGMTMGQVLCTVMIGCGLFLVVRSRALRAAEDPVDPAAAGGAGA